MQQPPGPSVEVQQVALAVSQGQRTRSALSAAVARRIAGNDGAINMLEARRPLPDTASGNLCYLRAEMAVYDRDMVLMKRLRHCLEATLTLRPDDVDALAGLARIGIWEGRTGGGNDDFVAALDHAMRAFRLDPTSIRAGQALMIAQYHLRENQPAIATGRYLLRLNPENNLLTAHVALITFLAGDSRAGLDYARRAHAMSDHPARDASTVDVLSAFLRGDYAASIAASEDLAMDDVVIALVRLLAISRMNDPQATRTALDAAQRRYPDLDRLAASLRCERWGRPDLRAALASAMDGVFPGGGRQVIGDAP